MSFANIFYIFGVIMVALSGATILPLLLAVTADETPYIIAFLSTFLLTMFIGGGLILALRDMRRRSGMREAVFLILLSWNVLPVFAAIPLLMGGAVSTFGDAYFEATSALTTTGATLIRAEIFDYRSLLLWRSVLQWLGGFGAILMAVGIFSALSLSGLPLMRPPVKLQRGHYLLERLRPVTLYLFSTYALLTLMCFILIWMSGLIPFEALCLAFSTLSTGGYLPRPDSFGDFGKAGTELVVFVFMILGGLNLVLHHDGLRGSFKPYNKDVEFKLLLALILFFGVILFAQTLGDKNASRHFFSSLFNAASLLTTTGYAIGAGEPMSGVPVPIILAMVWIGGSAMSTAGGLKLIRFLLLGRHFRAELNRLSHPHSIAQVRYNGQGIDLSTYTNIWIYFVCFMVLIGIVALAFALLGYDFNTALSVSVATLSNTGPILDYVTPDDVTYAGFSPLAKWILSGAMIVGRIEILSLLPIFNRFYWEG